MRTQLVAVAKPAKAIFAAYGGHRGSLAAGGMAYFVLLAIAPAAVAIGALTGKLIGPANARSAIEAILEQIPGNSQEFKSSVDSILNVMTSASTGVVTLASIMSFFVAIYASSKAIMALRMALDTAFGFEGVRHGLVVRTRDAIFTLVGLILASTLVLILTLLPQILQLFGVTDFRLSTGVGWCDWLIFAAVAWGLVLALYRWAPSRKSSMTWKSPVAIAVTLWLLGASAGVGMYVSVSSTIGSAIAAFGAPMIVLLWLYFSFIGLLLGAEAQVYVAAKGEKQNG